MRRLTALVSLIVLLDLALWAAILPLLPHYADQLGLTKIESGALVAAYSLAVVVVSIPVGHLADRVGPRRVVVGGELLMALATAMIATDPGYAGLLAARITQGTASAVAWSAGLAWLAARAPVERRGRSISIANSAATVGMIVGPAIGGVVAGQFGISATFLGASLICLALAGWVLLEPAAALQPQESQLRAGLRLALRERVVMVALLVIALVSTVGGTLQTLMPLALGAGGVSQSAIGALYSVGAVLGAISIVLGGRIGDRRGRPPVAFWDSLVLAAAISVLLLPLGTHGLGAMVIVTAPVLSVLYGVGYPLSADGADRAGVGHGLALGMVNLIWGVGAVVGPIAGGLVGELLGDRVAYAVLVGLCLASAVVIRRTIMVLRLPGPVSAGSSPAGR